MNTANKTQITVELQGTTKRSSIEKTYYLSLKEVPNENLDSEIEFLVPYIKTLMASQFKKVSSAKMVLSSIDNKVIVLV